MPGPMPKRSEERTRRNKENNAGVLLKKGQAREFTWPAADSSWPPEVKKLYASFKKSGMSDFYQSSDAQWLWTACNEYADYRQSGRRSAMHLQSILSMFKDGLGITEGERRKMRIELELPEPEVEDELDVKRRELQQKARKKAS